MRFKTFIITFLCLVSLFSCVKDQQPVTQSFSIVEEKEFIMVGADSAAIHGEYVYPGIVNSMKIRVSTDQNLHGSVDYPILFSNGTYIVTISDLQAGTIYYYRYIVNLGATQDWQSEVFSFVTASEFPIVETLEVLMIDSLVARVKAAVVYDGGAEVTERGVCWNDYGDPTIDDFRLAHAEGGLGEYTCRLTELQPFMKYYVRAYAKNGHGTSYGAVIEFVTGEEINLPTVVTVEITDATSTAASCFCHVVDDGGAEVYERGACWSTSAHPNIADYVFAHGSGLGDYVVIMRDLTPKTTYYVRAYAKNSKGVNYGEELSFETNENLTPPPGAMHGLITVGEGRKVWFSQGNLQYQVSTNTWRFAENQYEYVGNDNVNIAPDYEGWIDLFGYATSGYEHGSACYQPWSTSDNPDSYMAYGVEGSQLYDMSGKADWGYNDIMGDGEGKWRTLTMEEWDYLLHQRNTPSGIRFAKAQVYGVNGLLILPDEWSNAVYYLNNVNQFAASFNCNVIGHEWIFYLQPNGAVFLPASGIREVCTVSAAGACGYYYSSECVRDKSYGINFDFDDVYGQTLFLNYGKAVRLVRDVEGK